MVVFHTETHAQGVDNNPLGALPISPTPTPYQELRFAIEPAPMITPFPTFDEMIGYAEAAR